MIITIVDRQGIKYTIDTSEAHDIHSIKNAFNTTLLLEGYSQEFINQINQQDEIKREKNSN